MITDREARLMELVGKLRGHDPRPAMSDLIERALDRLEEEIERTKDAHGHEHVSSGDHGGEFTSHGGSGGPKKPGAAMRKRRARAKKRKARAKVKTATGGGKAVDTRVKIAKRETGPKNREKIERARKAYDPKKSDLSVQRYADRQEEHVLSKIGGTQGSNNGSVDIVRKVGGFDHGLEVKTLINKGGPNKSGMKAQIKMEADQLARKQAWIGQASNRRSGVIVLDHRDRATSESGEFIGNKEAYSGHDLYYRRDYGAHRIGAMYPVKSAAELKGFLAKGDDELREMVRSDPKKYKGLIGMKK